jgi:hypothetical protein
MARKRSPMSLVLILVNGTRRTDGTAGTTLVLRYRLCGNLQEFLPHFTAFFEWVFGLHISSLSNHSVFRNSFIVMQFSGLTGLIIHPAIRFLNLASSKRLISSSMSFRVLIVTRLSRKKLPILWVLTASVHLTVTLTISRGAVLSIFVLCKNRPESKKWLNQKIHREKRSGELFKIYLISRVVADRLEQIHGVLAGRTREPHTKTGV